MQPTSLEEDELIDLGVNIFPDERIRLADLGYNVDWNGTPPVDEDVFLTYVILDNLSVPAEREEFLRWFLHATSTDIRHIIMVPGSDMNRVTVFFGFESAKMATIFLRYIGFLGRSLNITVFFGMANSAFI